MSNQSSQFYPPFAVVTETDHTAWIIIATALGLSVVLVFAVIRAHLVLVYQPRFGLVEGCFCASTIFTIIQSSVVLAACADGLGKSIDLVPAANINNISKMYYTSNLFFILAHGLSKLSVSFILIRLTPSKTHKKLFRAFTAAIAIWILVSFFALILQCNLAHPWRTLNEKCTGVFLRWEIISAFDILFELGLTGLAIYLVSGLQTTFENKVTVTASFASRLPLIIAISFRLATFSSIGLKTNPTFLQAEFIVWTQTELCYSVITATVPSIRPLMKALATSYGMVADGTKSSAARTRNDRSANLASGNDIELSNIRPKSKLNDSYNYNVWTSNAPKKGPRDNLSLNSNDSQRMIIKQDVQWDVTVN